MSNKHKRRYYINLESGISQWGVPANELLPAGWEMHLSKSKSDPFFTNFQKNISQWNIPTKEDGNKVPDGWKEMRSSNCNSIYYKNTKTGNVQWIIPDDLSEKPLDIKPVGIAIPTSFLPIVENCTLNNKWKKQDKKLGSGVSGSSYIACQGADCKYVIKIQEENKQYYTEIDALLYLQRTKAVPIVFAAWTCDKVGYFVMEKLYHCNKYDENFMWIEVGKKLDIIREAGYLHVDIHKDNVMCKKDGTVVLIDFGYAVKRTIKLDKQEYPDNMVSQSYNLPLTWEYLEILQENNHNRWFNPAAISLDKKSITKEQILADKKCTIKYTDARNKLLELQ
jgi:hypothetical protein